MKQLHIAVIGHPMPPHVGPTLPVVSTLVRRGHRVSYVTSREFSARVASTGAEVVDIPPFRKFVTLQEHERDNFQHPYCRFALRTLARITPFYEANPPDVIVYDFAALSGRILANRWNIPAVHTSATFSLHRDTIEEQARDPTWRRELLKDSNHADRFLLHHGIRESDFIFHRENLNIYFMPKALQPEPDLSDVRCFYAGRCAGEQLRYGEWHRNDACDRPLVLVTTSTVYLQGIDFFEMCIEALSDLKCHVILSIGDHNDAAALSPLPPHYEIVQGISHITILPHVSAFICLGGNITAAEATYHGVPMIVTSHGFPELEYQAENLARLGIALHLKGSDLNVNSLRMAASQALTDPSMRDSVTRVQRAVKSEPGAEETANRLEAYMQANCRISR